ncbi:MAG: Abi family protein, partial [Bacteroidales bacterium]|nr:Abi family protein [Bacteroidales bacterium]
YLYRIEINFRTFLIYTVSNFYREDPTWFSNPKFVDCSFTDYLCLCYNTIKKNDVIRLHHKRYKCAYAPAWKTIEFMTFGDLLKLFSCLKDNKLKQKISSHYNIRNPQVFFNFMNTIRVIRNLCAHGHNLYDLRLQKSIKTGPLQNMSEDMHHNLSGGLKVISYILHQISTNREQELHERITNLLHQPQIQHLECTQHIII